MQGTSASSRAPRGFLLNNGLSLVLLAAFAVTMAAQALTGHAEFDAQRLQRGEPAVSLGHYLRSGHFLEATGENWESEFLQMAFYVWLTSILYQKGSSE